MEKTKTTINLLTKDLVMLKTILDKEEEGRDINLTQLANLTKTTYYWTSKKVRDLELSGLIVLDKEGRIKNIKLTDKGRKIARLAKDIVENCGWNDEDEV